MYALAALSKSGSGFLYTERIAAQNAFPIPKAGPAKAMVAVPGPLSLRPSYTE